MANARAQKFVSDFSGGIFTRKSTAIKNINKHIVECIKIYNLAIKGLKLSGEKFSSREDSYKYAHLIAVRIQDLVEARDHMVWSTQHKCN